MDSSTSTMNQAYPSDEEKITESPVSNGVLQNSDVETEPKEKKASANNAYSIPNGGTLAWLQVLAAHILFFNSW
jgi:hypothetical protein